MQPLVQRGGAVVALQIVALERQVGEGMPPSTNTWMPCGRASRTMSRIGSTCPVRLVMCGSSMARVRGVMAASMARTSTPGSVKGTGNDTS
jgi:hypothetical protein